jgi:hypothetical protein
LPVLLPGQGPDAADKGSPPFELGIVHGHRDCLLIGWLLLLLLLLLVLLLLL